MADKRLQLEFRNESDKKVRISVDSPRDDLTEAEVRTAMEDIIARNVFNSSGGDLVNIAGARIITTDVTELTL
ncbi:DUF2922 domain-containing protein [Caldisalinibacter kiritimatiensis]|uniref:DUF2922 domain-containing protein n=1 Tax=Caldisalinibacter kiritimatiensis TaxID=1304284 RepID=R1AQK0_9FIRM|nr:DUF2922 domain-containing protein [Caldisalinibacter kiritimatiensis]EOC99402.1 hypothetical protein L21TH_2583 [Caldisalinibacter kiritimatiensis]